MQGKMFSNGLILYGVLVWRLKAAGINMTDEKRIFDLTCHPVSAWLNVNRQCNYRCRWCYASGTGYRIDECMSAEVAKELIDISQELGVSHINIIGGEPTLWPPLFEINDYIRNAGLTSGIITNAHLFSEDEFLCEYAGHPNDRLSVSVKAGDEKTFNVATGVKGFSASLVGIQRAVQLFRARVTTVYNSLVGLDGLSRIAKVCHDLGASDLVVNMCSPSLDGDGVDDSCCGTIEEIVDSTIAMTELLQEYFGERWELDIQLPLCTFPRGFIEDMLERNKVQTVCQVFSRTGLNFDYMGNVIVCNELYNAVVAKYREDFKDAQSLGMFLNSPDMKKKYGQLLRYPSAECVDCRWNTLCHGGCLMNWLVYRPSICHAVT